MCIYILYIYIYITHTYIYVYIYIYIYEYVYAIYRVVGAAVNGGRNKKAVGTPAGKGKASAAKPKVPLSAVTTKHFPKICKFLKPPGPFSVA